MVDNDGKNRYPNDANWLTDGYGDYVRHFLRAMDAMPRLAPSDEDHLLSSSSVIQSVSYNPDIEYNVFDKHGTEVFRLQQKPVNILFNDKPAANGENAEWKALGNGGLLIITRAQSGNVKIIK
jgi:hypothetical protein